MTRSDLLEAAKEIVTKDRTTDYGTPENNFKTIAELWTTYLGVPISTHQVPILMALLKIARLKQSPAHTDSLIDLAGYAACAAEVAPLPVGAAFMTPSIGGQP